MTIFAKTCSKETSGVFPTWLAAPRHPQKIHYWVKQGWIHSRRTPSGKHLIVWADKDELRRLKQMAREKQSWLRTRHPNLIIPKRRPAR